MGDHSNFSATLDRSAFGRALLDDLRTLEHMLADGRIERDTHRFGAEQELYLVYPDGRPAPIGPDIVRALQNPAITTELARFNLEINLPVIAQAPNALAEIHRYLDTAVADVRAAARERGADVLLVGIAPSVDQGDLGDDAETPEVRYRQLNSAYARLAGNRFRLRVQGPDELDITHPNVLLEAANTSLQVHVQVDDRELPAVYNAAQLVAAPVLAAAENSPLFMQRRLWRETRIAVFEQTIDGRTASAGARGAPSRVWFGTDWIRESALELFRRQVWRFRPLMATMPDEPSSDIYRRGDVPALRALCQFNGTVYPWNRICYGVHAGRPHLRLEVRYLPAGPTVLDEVANAAFLLGAIFGVVRRWGDVSTRSNFQDVRDSFRMAAQFGLRATVRWDDRDWVARDLILNQLLPLAEEGLAALQIDPEDAARYLIIVRDRVIERRTGAQWLVDGWNRLAAYQAPVARGRALTRALLTTQQSGKPVHAWDDLPGAELDWRDLARRVDQIMSTDVFTVDPDEAISIVAAAMQWRHVRHVPVEDGDGRLVGMLSHRALLTALVASGEEPLHARDIMATDLTTVAPGTTCKEAIELMETRRVGSVLVVRDGMLVGIVTVRDLLRLAEAVLDDA